MLRESLNVSLYEALCLGKAEFVDLLINWGASPSAVSYGVLPSTLYLKCVVRLYYDNHSYFIYSDCIVSRVN